MTLNRNSLTPDLGNRERAYVFSVAMKYVKDEVAADDVTQEALLRAHLHRDSFRGDARFSTWLYRIAATSALMYLRRAKRLSRERLYDDREEVDGYSPYQVAAPDAPIDEVLAARQSLAEADRELRLLGEKYRAPFWDKFAGGYSEAEVATRAGCSLSAAKSRTFRARQRVCGTLARAA